MFGFSRSSKKPINQNQAQPEQGPVIEHPLVVQPLTSRHNYSARSEHPQITNPPHLPPLRGQPAAAVPQLPLHRLQTPRAANELQPARRPYIIRDHLAAQDPEQPPEASPVAITRPREKVLDHHFATYLRNLGVRDAESSSESSSDDDDDKYKGREYNRHDRLILTGTIVFPISYLAGAGILSNNDNPSKTLLYGPWALLIYGLCLMLVYFCFDKARDRDDKRKNTCSRWWSRALTRLGMLFFLVSLPFTIFNTIVASIRDDKVETINGTTVITEDELPGFYNAISATGVFICFAAAAVAQAIFIIVTDLIGFDYVLEFEKIKSTGLNDKERYKAKTRDIRNQLASEVLRKNEELKVEKTKTKKLEEELVQLKDHLTKHHGHCPIGLHHMPAYGQGLMSNPLPTMPPPTSLPQSSRQHIPPRST